MTQTIRILMLIVVVATAGCAKGVLAPYRQPTLCGFCGNPECDCFVESYVVHEAHFFGYHPTCWRLWPHGWVGCPQPWVEVEPHREDAEMLGEPALEDLHDRPPVPPRSEMTEPPQQPSPSDRLPLRRSLPPAPRSDFDIPDADPADGRDAPPMPPGPDAPPMPPGPDAPPMPPAADQSDSSASPLQTLLSWRPGSFGLASPDWRALVPSGFPTGPLSGRSPTIPGRSTPPGSQRR